MKRYIYMAQHWTLCRGWCLHLVLCALSGVFRKRRRGDDDQWFKVENWRWANDWLGAVL